MILHEIKRYASKVFHQVATFPYPQHQPHHPTTHYYPGNEPNEPLTKFEFAKFLQSLDYKEGDWVSYKGVQVYSEWNLHYVQSIDEIHYLIKDWGTTRTGPKCVWLRYFRNNPAPSMSQPLLNGASLFTKVDHARVPSFLRDMIEKDPPV